MIRDILHRGLSYDCGCHSLLRFPGILSYCQNTPEVRPRNSAFSENVCLSGQVTFVLHSSNQPAGVRAFGVYGTGSANHFPDLALFGPLIFPKMAGFFRVNEEAGAKRLPAMARPCPADGLLQGSLDGQWDKKISFQCGNPNESVCKTGRMYATGDQIKRSENNNFKFFVRYFPGDHLNS